MKSKNIENRYSIKLLFQFRIVKNKVSNKRRLCEERILRIDAANVEDAIDLARIIGENNQHKYKNKLGEVIHFEFIGILDIIKLHEKMESSEVWYEFKRLAFPMERKSKLLPNMDKLKVVDKKG